MIKRILIFILITLLFFVSGYFLNSYLLDANQVTIRFSLLTLYTFLMLSCIIAYALVEVVSTYLPNETGYLYLGLLMVKLGVFILLFQEPIFSETGLSKAEKSSILIPFLIFLTIEVIGVSKLLNNK